MKASLASLIFLLLTACTLGAVGPRPSSELGQREESEEAEIKVSSGLNVIVPVFDPGLPKDSDNYEKEGIWPELRNAESLIFAMNLRDALEKTGAFGAVRVTPDTQAIGELYVIGKILKSTSEEVAVSITVTDISNYRWMKGRKFKYRVREYDLKSKRNQGKDPYQPLYDEISDEIVKLIARRKENRLVELTRIADVSLARSYSDQEFGKYLTGGSRRVKLKGFPASGDVKFQKIRHFRVQEELFADELQKHYRRFVTEVGPAYSTWQRDSFPEAKEYRLAREKAQRQAIGAAIAGVGAAYLAHKASESDGNAENIARAAATVAAVTATGLAYRSFRTRADAVHHADVIRELGQAIDAEFTDTNIQIEAKLETFTGSAAAQMQQFREVLRQWYERDRTPEIQL